MSQVDDAKIMAMRVGGRALGRVLDDLVRHALPGVRLLSLEEEAVKGITQAGGLPSFPTVEGYRWATCICLNEEIVHGIPNDRTLAQGDLITIDIGMLYKGFHTDTAWTMEVGKDSGGEVGRFLSMGKLALAKAIREVGPGKRVGHISKAIQDTIEPAGYSVVKSLVGHGVGATLHEEPQIPGYVRGRLENSQLLTPGMTIAIEVIYAMGKGQIAYANDDGWTIATGDGSLSSVFEHTVLVTDEGAEILTRPESADRSLPEIPLTG